MNIGGDRRFQTKKTALIGEVTWGPAMSIGGQLIRGIVVGSRGDLDRGILTDDINKYLFSDFY